MVRDRWDKSLEMLHVRIALTNLHTDPAQHGSPLHLLGSLGLDIGCLRGLGYIEFLAGFEPDHPVSGLFIEPSLIKVRVVFGELVKLQEHHVVVAPGVRGKFRGWFVR